MAVIESKFIKRSAYYRGFIYRIKIRGGGYRLTLIEAVSESTWRGACDY